jgi:hypothetical protein
MARFRRKAKRYFGKAKKYYSKHKSGISPLKCVLFGAGYGAIRDVTHKATSGITSMIPLGQYSDEVAYGALGYFMARSGNSMIKNAGLAILTVESASIGQQVISPMIGGMTGSSVSTFKGY